MGVFLSALNVGSRGDDSARDTRFMQNLCCVLPPSGATDGGASEHPGLRLAGLRHKNLPTFGVQWSSPHPSPFHPRWRGEPA